MNDIVKAKLILTSQRDLSIGEIAEATDATAKEVIGLIVHQRGNQLAKKVIELYGDDLTMLESLN